MPRLDLLDPTRPDDPAFDPTGAQAHRVRAAALRREPPPAPAPRRTGRRLALAGAAIAAAAVIVVVGGTSTAPPDARAALHAAARATAAADSGRVVITVEGEGAGYAGRSRTEIRFQGADLEMVRREDAVFPDGRRMRTATTTRLIDGIAYERDDSAEGAGFTRLGKLDPVTFQVTGQYDDDGLVALVRGARDVKATEADGATVYTGTTTAGAVEDAAPTAHGRSQGGAWDREVRLEVAVGEDDLIRHVVVREGGFTRTTRYLDLGEPQTIERP